MRNAAGRLVKGSTALDPAGVGVARRQRRRGREQDTSLQSRKLSLRQFERGMRTGVEQKLSNAYARLAKIAR